MTYDAIVIGAGVNGLVAAASLGRAGQKVLVVEEQEALGGVARAVEFAPGFHAAPFATDPGWLPPAVAKLIGRNGPAYAEAPLTLAVAPDEFLTLWADRSRATQAVRRHSNKDAENWPAFTAQIRALTGFLERSYERPPPSATSRTSGELVELAGLGLAFRKLGRRNMTALMRALPMSAQDLLDEWFESEPVKAAIASTAVQNLRQGPRSGGTSLALLHHLVGAPAGSMRRAGNWANAGIVAVLEDAARRNGTAIRTNARVERIQIADDEVRGIVLKNGEEIRSRTVLSSADPSRTMLGMVDPVWLDPEFLRAIGNIKYRGCTAFVVYGLDRLVGLPGGSNLPQLLSGIVSLTPSRDSFERAYDAAKYGSVSERPHVEFTIPTIEAPHHAPAGRHVLVARVQYAPYRLREGNSWDSNRRDALAAHVTTAITAAIPRFEDYVVQRTVFAPTDVEKLFGSTEGATHQGELMLDQFLFMRPVPGWAHYRMPIEGLYLGGSGTHPGHGVIGGSGYNAAQRIMRDLSRGRARRED